MSIEKIEQELLEGLGKTSEIDRYFGWEDRYRDNAANPRCDRQLITACSPENIRALLDELSRLRTERDEALAEIERMTPKFVAYEYLESPAGREIVEARVAKLEKALEPFAKFGGHKTSYVELPVRWCEDAARTLSEAKP